MSAIDVHSDDYALTVHTSEDIIDCMKKGCLGSISVTPNMSCTDACAEMLYRAVPELPFLPAMSVHLDFVEGRSLAGAASVPMLAEPAGGLMKLSWAGLFLASYLPWKRRQLRRQLKIEIKAQIEAAQRVIGHTMEIAAASGVPCRQTKMRIDSHQHTHMIPVVWEALTEVIAEARYEVEYIRNAKEPLGVFLKTFGLWRSYRPVNIVKNVLLWLYSGKVDRYAQKHGLPSVYMWGLVMSGHMDYERISRLYAGMKARAERGGRDLELVFHPGMMLAEETTDEIDRAAADAFYLSGNRRTEKNAVEHMGELIR